MANKDKVLVTGDFLKHLAKGGIKIIPIFGGLLEEMIFGTLDAKTAGEEVKKLRKVIETIQEKSEAQSTEVSGLIVEIREGAALGTEARDKLDELRSAMFDPRLISVAITSAIERFLQNHEKRIEDVAGDLEAVVDQLVGAGAALKTLPENSDRIDLLNQLAKLANSDLKMLITALEASAYVADKSSGREQASELLIWAESSAGPGIDKIAETARRVIPNFHLGLPQKRGPSTADVTWPRPLSIKVRHDGGFTIVGGRKDHEIPHSFILSSHQGRKAAENPQYWKKVHSLLERYLRDFTILQGYMTSCNANVRQGDLRIVDFFKREAQDYLLIRNSDFYETHSEIMRLRPSRMKVMLFLRQQLPSCWEVLKRSFSSPPESEDFQAGVRLVDGVARLLWDALHVADQILEAYFRQEGGEARDASAGAR